MILDIFQRTTINAAIIITDSAYHSRAVKNIQIILSTEEIQNRGRIALFVSLFFHFFVHDRIHQIPKQK